MQKGMNTIKDMVTEYTSQTFGTEIPDGLCFSTCFPISIFLDIKQIKNSICCGDAPKNNGTVTHCWLTLFNEDTILDPTIRQFDPSMESTYIGKLTESEVTKKYVPVKTSFQEWFVTSYNIWTEPLIDKRPRTIERAPGFEDKMNLLNIKTATILYAHIEKMSSKDQFMRLFKCERYFSPIFNFLKDKSSADKKIFDSLTELMPKDFNLLLSKALNNN
jgi:hypothetical protein